MRFIKDVLVVACWTLFLLVLLECGLRVSGAKYDGSFYQSDPVTYTAFRPNAAGWVLEGENFSRINSHGMHDVERSLAKPPNTLRLAILGDSVVAAQQVPVEKTMAQVLERILSNAASLNGYRIEVLNFGVGGYTLAQTYLTQRDKVWAFQPDIIVLFLSNTAVPSTIRSLYRVGSSSPFFVYNDGQLVPDPHNRPPEALDEKSMRWTGQLKDLYNQVYLLQLALKVLKEGIPEKVATLRRRQAASAAQPVNNVVAFPFRPARSPEEGEAWHVTEGLLKFMSSNATEHGAEFLLFSFGDEIQCDPDPAEREKFLRRINGVSLDYTDRRLQELAERQHIRFFAMAPRLLDYATRHNVLLRGFFNTRRNYGHFNERGNAIAAGIAANELIRRSERLGRVITEVNSDQERLGGTAVSAEARSSERAAK